MDDDKTPKIADCQCGGEIHLGRNTQMPFVSAEGGDKLVPINSPKQSKGPVANCHKCGQMYYVAPG